MAPPKMPNSSTLPSGGNPDSYGSNGAASGSPLGGAAALAEASAGAASFGAAALAEASLVAPSALETDTEPEVPAAWAKALPATVRLNPHTNQLVSGLDIS